MRRKGRVAEKVEEEHVDDVQASEASDLKDHEAGFEAAEVRGETLRRALQRREQPAEQCAPRRLRDGGGGAAVHQREHEVERAPARVERQRLDEVGAPWVRCTLG